ncbi:MAG TPA: nucleoside triphosphate pyrophosphohydrolase [Chitinophagales bacterium]|nr:nucleoside triphosphate pyrophosphohydrolase [Chitinophagales bacterium]
MRKEEEAFGRLLKIMDELREKCPWDKKQTLQSLRNLTIEETYELADALFDEDMEGIKEELGDLLLHLVFYAKIASEKNAFSIRDVIEQQCQKLINRHPHIYGDMKVNTEEEVKKNWEKIKLKEGKKSILAGVPSSLPALIKAYRIQDKAKQVGFQWEHSGQVWDKVKEEINELEEEFQSHQTDADKLEDEFGDLLFALVNFARYVNVDPERALEKANKKFVRRFQYIEHTVSQNNGDLKKMSLQEMDALWDKAKHSGL